MNSYLPMGDGANKPANAPTAAEPKAIKPSGIVAAVTQKRDTVSSVFLS